MTIKVMGINGGTHRSFDHVTDYDLTKYPIVELASEQYMARVILKVPEGCYISVVLDGDSEEQNES